MKAKNYIIHTFCLILGLLVSSLIHATEDKILKCDELAAHPSDPQKKGTGVAYNQINAQAAIAACQRDLKANPNNIRLIMNLSRAYNKLNRFDESFRLAQQAANLNYPFALHLLSIHYLLGEGVAKDTQQEIIYLRKAANLGVADSYKSLADKQLALSFDQINFEAVFDDIKQGQKLGLSMHDTLGNFYYSLNEKIKFSILNADSIESLNLVLLRVYRDNLLKAQHHYTKFLEINNNNSIKEKLKTVNFALENTSTEDNIKKKIALKKSLINKDNKTSGLQIDSDYGSFLALRYKAKRWDMLTPKGEFKGLKLQLNKAKAKLIDTFGEKAWQTASETWLTIKDYEDNWKIVIYAKSQADVRKYISELHQVIKANPKQDDIKILGVIEL